MKNFAILSCLVLIPGVVFAQELPRFTFDAGAGFTTPRGQAGSNLDYGWNVAAGAGVNITSHLGVMLDLGFNSMGVNSTTLTNLGFGGGNVKVFSATIDPIVHLTPRGPVDVYITGGGGFYHYYQDFSQPTVFYGTAGNPFFGYYPVAVPGQVIVSSYSTNKPGWDVGAGVAFGSKWGGKFFAEAKYNRVSMGPYYTDYIPVTFGFRR